MQILLHLADETTAISDQSQLTLDIRCEKIEHSQMRDFGLFS